VPPPASSSCKSSRPRRSRSWRCAIAITDSPLPPKFDALDPALLDDPNPTYTRLRDAGRLCRGGVGQWVVPRYDDVAPLLRDNRFTKNLPERYYDLAGTESAVSAFLARMNLGRRNRRASRLLAKAFRPVHIRGLEGRMEGMVDELLEPLLERRELDVVSDLALPFPVLVMCDLLGIPAADRDLVWPRAADLVAAFSDAAFLSERDMAIASVALEWLQDYLGGLVAERRQAPREDLLSRLLDVDETGQQLTDEEIVDNAITVFYAGFETSKGMLSNGLAALLEQPDELARLQADHSLVPTAVDEFLRYEAPIQISLRAPLEPVEVAGRTIRPGRVLVLLLGSANRDERRFPEPDRLDVGRRPNPHVSFGGGVFYCLGAALSKSEGEVALRRLLERVATFELAGEPVRRPLLNFRSYERLPLAITPK
jgi:cytochrome P450